MNRKKEKGFALILSLVLLLVMSLMGGSLIVIASGDHKSNNTSDEYQQVFFRNIGFDAAENEPCDVFQVCVYRSPICDGPL